MMMGPGKVSPARVAERETPSGAMTLLTIGRVACGPSVAGEPGAVVAVAVAAPSTAARTMEERDDEALPQDYNMLLGVERSSVEGFECSSFDELHQVTSSAADLHSGAQPRALHPPRYIESFYITEV
jgi:hypothetical protein